MTEKSFNSAGQVTVGSIHAVGLAATGTVKGNNLIYNFYYYLFNFYLIMFVCYFIVLTLNL